MLDNIKWVLYKNNAAKLMEIYSTSKVLREFIIDRLFMFNEVDHLLEIAKIDRTYRTDILMQLIDENKLEFHHIQPILRWLPNSTLYEQLLKYIHGHFSDDQIDIINKTFQINFKKKKSNSNLSHLNINPSDLVDDDYRELLKLTSGTKIDYNYLKDTEEANKILTIRDFVFWEELEPSNNKLQKIKDFLSEILKSDYVDAKLLLTIINISGLDSAQKKSLIKGLKDSRLFYPEFFELITSFSEISLKKIRSFFSLSTVLDWSAKYVCSHWIYDLYCLYLKFPIFQWVKEYLQDIKIVGDVAKNVRNFRLLDDVAYSLFDVIGEEEIRQQLHITSKSIRELILINLNFADFAFEDYFKLLLKIGGEENIKFVSSFLKKQIVENYSEKIKQVEEKYRTLKQQNENPDFLVELIQEEVKEKTNIIAQGTFHLAVKTYLEYYADYKYIHPNSQKYLKKYIPNFANLLVYLNMSEKINLAKFLSILNIDQSMLVLNELSNDENDYISIIALLGRINLFDEEAEIAFKKNFETKKSILKKHVASNLLFMTNITESILIDLSADDDPEVNEPVLNIVSSYEFYNTVKIFNKIISNGVVGNPELMIKILSDYRNEKAIPLMISLIKKGSVKAKRELLISLGKINHNDSIKILKNLKYKDQFILEIERARSLILLGDNSGWDLIIGFMKFNIDFINKYAKLIFLELSGSEHFQRLRQLTTDEDPLVAMLAVAKISIFDEKETWKIVNNIIFSNQEFLKYYLAHFLTYFPVERTKPYLQKLDGNADYDTKMIIALLMAHANDYSYLANIEQNVMNLDESKHRLIIKAMQDFPQKQGLPILEKILLLQNPDIMEDILDIFLKLKDESLTLVMFQIWKIGLEETKLVISKLFAKMHSQKVTKFLLKEIDTQPENIKINLAYSLILHGEEKGWDYLIKMVESDNFKSAKLAIATIGDIGSPKALNVLSEMVVTTDENIRAEVIKAFGKINKKESLAIVKKYIRDASNKVRISVTKALGKLHFNESEILLNQLLDDPDEYVKVSAEVNLQKIERGFNPQYNFREYFEKILGSNDWKLDMMLFKRELSDFIRKYRKPGYYKLKEFNTKVIMDEDDINAKREHLKDELSKVLMSTTNTDEINQAKKQFQTELNKLATYDDLINTILQIKIDELDEDEMELLEKTVLSQNDSVIRALVAASAKSSSKRWINILEKIINEYEIDSSFVDYVVFSIIRRFSPKSLMLLGKIFQFERARYYFVIMCNFYFLHLDSISAEEIESAQKAIEKSSASDIHKKAAIEILQDILEKKERRNNQ